MSQAEKDAAVLFSERDLTIDSEQITVNEIKFTQGLKFGALIKPMISAMAELFIEKEDPEFDDIADIFSAHEKVVVQLMAVTTGKSIEWIKGLGDTDGQNLMMTFWAVNSDFFTRRIVSKGMTALLKNQPIPSATESSSQH